MRASKFAVLCVLLFCASLAAAAPRRLLKLTLSYERGRVSLVAATQLDAKVPVEDGGATSFSYDLADAAGAVLATGHFPDPTLFWAEDYAPDGTITGRLIRLEKTSFCLVVPYLAEAAQLVLRDSAGRRVGAIGLTANDLARAAAARKPMPQVWTTKTLVKNGDSSQRLDIVFLGDGYRASELPTFDTHVRESIEYLLSKSPYDRYSKCFNFYQVNVISNESGADDPGSGVTRDTALDSSYRWDGVTERLLYADAAKVFEAASLVPQYDLAVVIVNDTKYGGGGGQFVCFAGGNSAAYDIQYHELGHTLAGLWDEYADTKATYTGEEPSGVNVSTYPSKTMIAKQAKWYYWIGIQGVSTFEGAANFLYGLYRPAENCEMRALNQTYCPVCRERTVQQFYGYVDPIDGFAPASDQTITTDGCQLFSLTLPGIDTLDTTWYVDGKVQTGATGATFRASGGTLGVGQHTVKAVVTDGTGYVRRDPAGALTATQEWTLRVEQGGRTQSLSGKFQLGGSGVNGATAELARDDCYHQVASSAGDGSFAFAGLTEGNYELSVSYKLNKAQNKKARKPGLDGYLEWNGQAVAGARVTLSAQKKAGTGRSECEPIAPHSYAKSDTYTATTGADGRFQLPRVRKSGSYRIAIRASVAVPRAE